MEVPRCRLALLAILFCSPGGAAWAQRLDEPLVGRYEVAAGVSWTGSSSFGSRDASLTGASGDRYPLFSTATGLGTAATFDAHLGRRLTRIVQIELAASYSSPTLTTSVTNDVEQGAATLASESVRQFTIGGAAVVYLPRRSAARVLPFLTGGRGYLWQVHQGNRLFQTGRTYHVGAGAMIPFGGRRRAVGERQFGVRADLRALIRTGGVAVDGSTHTSPVVAVSAFARF